MCIGLLRDTVIKKKRQKIVSVELSENKENLRSLLKAFHTRYKGLSVSPALEDSNKMITALLPTTLKWSGLTYHRAETDKWVIKGAELAFVTKQHVNVFFCFLRIKTDDLLNVFIRGARLCVNVTFN